MNSTSDKQPDSLTAFFTRPVHPSTLRQAITAAYRLNEPAAVQAMLAQLPGDPTRKTAIDSLATQLANKLRARHRDPGRAGQIGRAHV